MLLLTASPAIAPMLHGVIPAASRLHFTARHSVSVEHVVKTSSKLLAFS